MTKESTAIENAQAIGGSRQSIAEAGTPCTLSIGDATPCNTVFLAPLSGISDVPFRRLARRFGAGLVVSEMVASGEFVRGHAESQLRAMRDGPGLHVVQLAGRDPVWMQAAAERLADLGADVIDINMGCPAKKVVGGLSGSALMREPELALSLVEATVKGAGAVPVTLKMRLGWDAQSMNAPELASRAEAAGVRMITVHGRTRAQFYEGSADWHAIAAVKAAVRVPLVANGDLTRDGDRAAMLRASGADAVMIGRGACGRPWFPGLVAGECNAAELARHSFAELVVEHYEAMLGHYGVYTGLRHARKHLGWYFDSFVAATGSVASEDRLAVMRSSSAAEVVAVLRACFGGTRIADVAFAEPIARQEAA